MKTDEKSNLISEEEFLKSLGVSSGGITPPETSIIQEKDSIEEIVNPENIIKEEENEEIISQKQQEEEQVEEQIQVEEQRTLKRFGIKDTINSLIENDIWSDIAVKIGDKQYDSIESLLQSEKPTKELFDSLSQVQKNLREEKINEEYVSIKGKDSTKVKLIKAILSNIEYEDLLEYNTKIVEPVQNFDFATQDIRKTELFVRQCLKDIDNIPDKYIDAEVQELIKDFKLIEKAEEFQEKVIQKYEEELDLRQKAQEAIVAQEEQERATSIKEFKKTLKDKDFSDSFIHKAVQLRYSKEEDGTTHYSKLLEEKLKDKEFASQFIHFLLDKDDFLKKEKSPVVEETTKRMMELIQVIPKERGGKATTTSAPQSLSTADEEFLNELNIRNDR